MTTDSFVKREARPSHNHGTSRATDESIATREFVKVVGVSSAEASARVTIPYKNIDSSGCEDDFDDLLEAMELSFTSSFSSRLAKSSDDEDRI